MGLNGAKLPRKYGRFEIDPFYDAYWTPRLTVNLNGAKVAHPISACVDHDWLICYAAADDGTIACDPEHGHPIVKLLFGKVTFEERT